MRPEAVRVATRGLDVQLDSLLGAGGHRPVDCGPGDLRVVAGAIEGGPLTVVGFDYARQHGSMGAREADQLIQVVRLARRERMSLVFLMNTSGVRVTEGTVGIAALRRALRAALDARLAGVRMVALIGRNCFGGASVLATTCERSVVNRHCMVGMSGPRMIEPDPDDAPAPVHHLEAAHRLLGGAARAALSPAFVLTDDDPEACRTALFEWMRTPPADVDDRVLRDKRARLGRRLRDQGRWPAAPAEPVAGGLEKSAAVAVHGVLGERHELSRAGQFLSARTGKSAEALVYGLVGGPRADAVDVLRLTEALADVPAGIRSVAVLLDCESHSTRAPDERVILSEYLACLALQTRFLHHRGVEVRLIVTGVSGGGIFAALACAASEVTIAHDARLRVLPPAAMAAINKIEGEAEGTVGRALETGAVDRVLGIPMESGTIER